MADLSAQPAFVLVRPQMGENIGAAARGDVEFRAGPDAARGAARRLAEPSGRRRWRAARGGCWTRRSCTRRPPTRWPIAHFVFATTARPRGLTKPVLSPEAAMREAAPVSRAGEKVAVLFGPERAGLENEDIARANAIVSVPVNPDFASLNLAQCVLLTAYEWRRATRRDRARDDRHGGRATGPTRPRSRSSREHYEERMERGRLLLSRAQGREHEAATCATSGAGCR